MAVFFGKKHYAVRLPQFYKRASKNQRTRIGEQSIEMDEHALNIRQACKCVSWEILVFWICIIHFQSSF